MRIRAVAINGSWRGGLTALLLALAAGCGNGDGGQARPSATPSASATPPATATPTARASDTPVPSATPSASATALPTSTETALPTGTATAMPTATATPFENVFLAERVLNIAHRGGNVLAPEATLEAMRSAVALGVDVLEMDLRGTADGAVVVIHDQTVDRTTDGSGHVQDLTLAEIRALDAGYRFTPDGGATFPFRGTGVRVPLFAEILAEHGDQFILAEIKIEGPSIVDAVVALLDEYDMRRRVVIASFDDAIIQQFRAAAPDVLTAFGLGEAVAFAGLTPEAEATYVPPAEFLQVPPVFSGIEVLTEAFLARAARFGLRIHVWDVRDETQMRALLALDIDGLIVDDPATLARVLAERDLAPARH